MPKTTKNSLTEPLIDYEELYATPNPLQEPAENDGIKPYVPPTSHEVVVGVELDSIDAGYSLTKERAQSTIIIEPTSRAPMTLFNYFIHKISQEAMQGLKEKPYGKERVILNKLVEKLNKANPGDDIKLQIRQFLNHLELGAVYHSQELFLERVRSHLNESLNFQPEITLGAGNRQDSAPKKFELFGQSKQSTYKRPEPRTPEDKWNATSRDIKEEAHAAVENTIKTSTLRSELAGLRGEVDGHEDDDKHSPGAP